LLAAARERSAVGPVGHLFSVEIGIEHHALAVDAEPYPIGAAPARGPAQPRAGALHFLHPVGKGPAAIDAGLDFVSHLTSLFA
jgi:hypothetical protein